MPRSRSLLLGAAATALVAAHAGAPPASAAPTSAKAKAAQSAKTLDRRLNAVRRRTAAAERRLRSLGRTLSTLQTIAAGLQGSGRSTQEQVNGVLTFVPLALDAVARLQQGSLSLQASLDALATRTTEGFAAAAAGLDELEAALGAVRDAGGADEYGIVQVAVADDALGADAGTAPDPVPGCFYESPDIPDNAQSVMVDGACLIPSAVPAGTDLHVLAGIRSNENDGESLADDDTGGAGLALYQQRDEAGALTGGGRTISPGAGQPPLIWVPQGSPLTPAGTPEFPYALVATDNVVDLAASQFDPVAGSPSPPEVAAGTQRVIELAVRFADLTVDPEDPKA